MRLHVPALIGALAVLPAAGPALAQSSGPAEAGIQIELGVLDQNQRFTPLNQYQRQEFLGLARCQCGILTPDTSQTPGPESFYVRLTLDSYDTSLRERADLVVGSNCDSPERQDRSCDQILTIGDVTNDLRGRPSYAIQVDRFMFPQQTECRQTTGKRGVYVVFDRNDDGIYEKSSKQSYDFDTEPPPLPVNIQLSPGESSAQLRWSSPASRQSDVKHYQVLCARADGSPAFASPTDDPRYDTAANLCGFDVPVPIQPPGTGGPDGGMPVADAGLPDAGPGSPDAGPDWLAAVPADLPDGLATLDPAYICGTDTGSSLGIRVGGLQDGETYHMVLLSIDYARNVTAVDLGQVTPQPVTDFWEDYHDQGGRAEGGICLVTSTFGDDDPMTQALRDFRDRTLAGSAAGRALIEIYYAHVAPLGTQVERHAVARVAAAVVLAPLAGLAAFWEYTGPAVKLLVLSIALGLGVSVRRRRHARAGGTLARAAPHARAGGTLARAAPRRTRPLLPVLAPATAIFLILFTASTPLAAQSDPYWDVFEPVPQQSTRAAPGTPHWNIGIKLGPYLPGVDSEFDTTPGPYERVFGGAGLMGIIELDRFFLWPIGQLGITASAGYMGKTASALLPGQGPQDDPARSPGEETSFRVVPMSAGVAYRLTVLDDRWRIPLVPYGRAGLSYYLWWIRAPDGSLARVPTPDCPNLNGCNGNRALGASLGWQASLGVALRAERLDPQAALSLRNELGIAHAGLYAEVVHAQVDGFGSDTRLHVGDTTWFAGVNFEF